MFMYMYICCINAYVRTCGTDTSVGAGLGKNVVRAISRTLFQNHKGTSLEPKIVTLLARLSGFKENKEFYAQSDAMMTMMMVKMRPTAHHQAFVIRCVQQPRCSWQLKVIFVYN